MRNNLRTLIKAFEPQDTEKKVVIENINREDGGISFQVRNSRVTFNLKRDLLRFFNGLHCSVTEPHGSSVLHVFVSLVDINQPLSFNEQIPYLRKNKDKGIYLGRSHRGEYFINIESFCHGFISGQTGRGKSVLLRSLICQLLSFQENVCVDIIDPKAIDFKPYEFHPKVGFVANTIDEQISLIQLYHFEVHARRKIFKDAFEVPPNSLSEYHQLKEKFNRTDLPPLPRRFLIVDESANLFSANFECNSEAVSKLTRMSRAFGIHVIFASQRPTASDIPNSVFVNCTNNFMFYSPTGQHLGHYSGDPLVCEHQMKDAVGRLYYLDRKNQSMDEIQTPYLSSEDALTISEHFSCESTVIENKGFIRMNLKSEHLDKGSYLDALCMVKDLDKIDPASSRRYPSFNETYCKHIHNVIAPEPKVEVKESDILDSELVDLEKIREELRRPRNG